MLHCGGDAQLDSTLDGKSSHGNTAACLSSSLHHECSVSVHYGLHKLEGCPYYKLLFIVGFL